VVVMVVPMATTVDLGPHSKVKAGVTAGTTPRRRLIARALHQMPQGDVAERNGVEED
jgi:hypothetical protein